MTVQRLVLVVYGLSVFWRASCRSMYEFEKSHLEKEVLKVWTACKRGGSGFGAKDSGIGGFDLEAEDPGVGLGVFLKCWVVRRSASFVEILIRVQPCRNAGISDVHPTWVFLKIAQVNGTLIPARIPRTPTEPYILRNSRMGV